MMNNIDIQDLYLFDLPEKVLESLELVYFDSSTTEVPSQDFSHSVKQNDNSNEIKEKANIANNNSCSVCNYQFDDQIKLIEKKEHYKSDFHKLNLKRAVNDLPPLNETEFDKIVEEESIESLSGSEDSESEKEDEEESPSSTRLETIIENLNNVSVKNNRSEDDEDEETISYLNTNSPFIFFKSSLISQEKVFGVYKSVFTEQQLLEDPLKALSSFSKEPIKSKKSALFMIGGGHFAGAIISHIPKNIKGNAANFKETKQEQMTNIIESKTFHRYTTRKKQGGSQSASDNARGKANSAGSSIRRYNEQALIKEVRELILSWKTHLDDCTSIYIRANGSSNRRILVGYEGCVLHNGDDRIRSFPFTTKRATTSELKKAWSNLSYLNVHDMPKSNEKLKKRLKKQRDNLMNSQQQNARRSEVTVLSDEDKHSDELTSFIKKSKAPMLINYIRKNKLSANFELSPREQYVHYPTLLHFASSQNMTHMVHVLLVNMKADPTLTNKFGKTPFELAGNTATRRAFQIARYSLGEDYCDWKKSKVGNPKSKEEVDQEQKEEQKKVDQENKKAIEEELANRTEMELKKPTFSSGGTLGSTKFQNSLQDISGLSDQQKMRIMREQRARAAEARMKRMQGT